MAGVNNTYHINDLDDLEEKAADANPENFVAARGYISRLLNRNSIKWALMGGYSLSLRGSSRRTFDIDVAVQATMLTMQKIIKDEQQLLRPRGPSADVLRTFVKTGQPYDESSRKEQLVEVDFLIGGSLGGPGSNANAGIEYFSIAGQQFPMHDIPTMMRNKLKSFNARQSDNDLSDIKWLAKTYTQIICNVRDQLSYEHKEFFYECYLDKLGQGENLEWIKQILGVEWPPRRA